MNRGIKGRLMDMSLVDIIQTLHLSRKTAVVKVGAKEGAGSIFMDNGNLVHARFREFLGEDALYDLLTWRDGEFEVELDIKSEERTISQSVDGLLLEGMKRLDETNRSSLNKERLFDVGEKESIYLVQRLVELGILLKKEV